MTVNDRLIEGGKSRCKAETAVMLVALVLGAGIASAETHPRPPPATPLGYFISGTGNPADE